MDKELLHTGLLAFATTAGLGKAFLIVARSMPPLPPTANYAARWFYDSMQLFAENQDKVGKVQDLAKPIGQAKQTLTASETTVSVPEGIEAIAVAGK